MSSNASNIALTPAQQVVNTTELLEQILSFLPMQQVLGKSRVSRKWKATISGSPALRRKLFLRHRESQAEVLATRQDSWRPKGETKVRFSPIGIPVYTSPIELNPLVDWDNQAVILPQASHEIRVKRPEPLLPSHDGTGDFLGKYSRAYVRHRFGGTRSTARVGCNPSWRDMFLTRPPITDIIIDVPTSVGRSTFVERTEHIRVNIHVEHGVTLGLLSDKVEEMLKKFPIKDRRDRSNGPLQPQDFVDD